MADCDGVVFRLSREAELAELTGYAGGTGFGTIISVITFLALIAYFFNDEPVNGLIAMFLVFAAHHVVNMLLVIASGWLRFRV